MKLYLNNLNTGEHVLANIDVLLDKAMILTAQIFADDKDIMDCIKQRDFKLMAQMIGDDE